MNHFNCLVEGFTTRQVGDAEYRCNRCDGDQSVMETAAEGLLLEHDWCKRKRWPEHHSDNCGYCAYVAAGGPVCKYDRTPLIDDQERHHDICHPCWDEGTQETA